MTKEQFRNLHEGDLVKSSFGGAEFIVHDNYDGLVTAVKTIRLVSPSEWDLVMKAKHKQEQEETPCNSQ